MKPFIKFGLIIALLGAAGGAHAALQCSVPSGVALNFGTYDDSSATTKDVSTTFSVNCCRMGAPNPTVGTMTIKMGVSTNSGQINTRQMKNTVNTDRMNYQLYYTSFGGTVWGDGAIGGSAYTQGVSVKKTCAAGGTVIAVSSAVFGRIFAQQAVRAGSYADTVTITITP